jgi:hypothetical protein
MNKKYGLHAVLILACAAIIIFPMMRDKPDPEKEQLATVAANQFLAQVDQTDFGVSWDIGGELLKEKVTREEWVDKLSQIHAITGRLVERKQTKSTFTTSAMDAPDGEYITFLYDSNFEKRTERKESIITTLEADGVWRVAGYHIK